MEDGDWYSDGFLGKYAEIKIETQTDKQIEISLYNTEALQEQIIQIDFDGSCYDIYLNENENKTIILDVSTGNSKLFF